MAAPGRPVAASGSPEVIVRVAHLSKRFPARRSWRETLLHPFKRETRAALSDISCQVSSGEFFGLLGPNGAGKTTFLKILTTLVAPDIGEVSVGGHDVRREGAAVRRLTSPCLATERSLLWRLTASENLQFYAGLLGIPKGEVAARIDEALAAVSLEDTGNKMVGQFSSGMMQRLLIARALLARPRLLLLDEPTRSLDPVAARDFRRFLRDELVERRGCAVILATHNAEEALDLCDRVAVLDRGRLLSSGTASELSRKYVGSRYRLVTRESQHPALKAMVERGVVGFDGTASAPQDGWSELVLRLPDGDEAAAGVLAGLVNAGMTISRFEAVSPSLADLISAVVEQEKASSGIAAQRMSGVSAGAMAS
jgi:ABC-2 type transport system ATP-binding protein